MKNLTVAPLRTVSFWGLDTLPCEYKKQSFTVTNRIAKVEVSLILLVSEDYLA